MNEKIQALLTRMQHSNLPAIDLGLERVEALLALLGSPHKKLPPVIHVAGTNGKGSLLAYLNAIFAAAGYKVHRYTSPHLVRFNERIQLAGGDIADEYLEDVLQRVATFIDQQPVTIFESITAAALLAFSEQPADVLLLETGMGGRLDATNVVDQPVLTVITPVSYDHQQFLGNTIAEIAAEKAGIIKNGVPCVVGKQEKEALEVIKRKARELNAPLSCYHRDWKIMVEGNKARYRSAMRTRLLQPALAGNYQFDNAATALACIEKLSQFTISDDHITQGLAEVKWPARLQRLKNGRFAGILPEGIELWLDGGHNPQGGQVLAQWLSEQNGKEVYLICGMARGKDSESYLRPLAPHVKQLYGIAFEWEVQSQTAEALCQSAAKAGIKAIIAESIENSLQTITQHARTPAIICICGSLYLAGKALAENGE